MSTLYLGPLFESTAHGYDTVDYFHVDRRLGTDRDLIELVEALHHAGIRVILDGVFNHVGRDFWALHQTRQDPHGSPYRDWFSGYTTQHASPLGDPFSYDAWEGHFELVKLNLHNPAVKKHLFDAVERWIEVFGIDGLRLDVAYCLEKNFLRELGDHCKKRSNDFWMMGEIIHGDYRGLLDVCGLDSVTNYECYKGLYSSHNDANMFEIAYALNRQFGPQGIYRNRPLYNFADNHDVNRIGSTLHNPAHLFTLYCLLFTMPGIPSIYYGSEWGVRGTKKNCSDRPIRPSLELEHLTACSPAPKLPALISTLSRIRKNHPVFLHGDYTQVDVSSNHLVFTRKTREQTVVVMINISNKQVECTIPTDGDARFVDLLNEGDCFESTNGQLTVDPVHPCWARILLKV